jgi:hypothetical protein
MKTNRLLETETGIFPSGSRADPQCWRGARIRRRGRDGRIMKTSQPVLIATPQFDSGRWKLRLERVPSSTDKQFTGPVVSSIAVGFTMLSPLVCLIAAYLWARVVG